MFAMTCSYLTTTPRILWYWVGLAQATFTRTGNPWNGSDLAMALNQFDVFSACNRCPVAFTGMFRRVDYLTSVRPEFESDFYDVHQLLHYFTVPEYMSVVPQGTIKAMKSGPRKTTPHGTTFDISFGDRRIPDYLTKFGKDGERLIYMCTEVKFKREDLELCLTQLAEQLQTVFQSGRSSPHGVLGLALMGVYGQLYFQTDEHSSMEALTPWMHVTYSRLSTTMRTCLIGLHAQTTLSLEPDADASP
ncbi:uncharacterized protein LOC129594132 [Paramacrobiotus metropolitanus]|uniref:uncharacterized protein LOC129594132 n=1 Tax=Paramacrobiotus metropolitanus TaxID=2943436 RepID=UPI002445D1A9|nr:uncharacterized protein LOC129594132 [Paramacrobiotus metropolitanus]